MTRRTPNLTALGAAGSGGSSAPSEGVATPYELVVTMRAFFSESKPDLVRAKHALMN